MYQHGLIAPAVALVLWSLVVLFWLYLTRIPAMRKAGIDPRTATREALQTLPKGARNVADNYNHLMEQPTLFYVLCFALQLMGQTHPINIGLAWTYVALRVVHSIFQGTINFVPVRFFIFCLSTVPLVALAIHAAIGVGFLPPLLPHG